MIGCNWLVAAISSKDLRFLVAGAINTVVSYLLFYVLIIIGLYYVVASIFSYTIATLVSYFLNKSWVFGKRENSLTLISWFVVINLSSLFNKATIAMTKIPCLP